MLLLAAIFFFGSQILSIYVDALWFSSLGYSDAYWYKFRLGSLLFVIFLALTFLIMRFSFALLDRALPQLKERPRVRPVSVEDLKQINFLPLIYRPGVWVLSGAVALMSALSLSQAWPAFALYLNRAQAGEADPIFKHDVSFYLFTLPALELISGWLLTLTFILLLVVAAAAGYVTYIEQVQGFGNAATRRRATAATSIAGAGFAIALAISTYLDRFDLLHTRHDLFTGLSYTDANVRLVAMLILAIALVGAAVALVANAFVFKRGRLLGWVAAAVVAVWLVGLVIVPQAVQSFSVKPNELAKESPFIQHNIDMTRKAFGLSKFEEKPFPTAPTLTAEQIQANWPTIENIRLWDQQTLLSNYNQNEAVRTYYEFRVPDVDRYVINGKLRQVLLAAREMNVDRLPDQSRNWINQHLVYTHGYGVAMSPVNEFNQQGGPRLLLKNMPVESEAPEIKVTQPQIYFGEVTNSHVYVHTKPQGSTQPEFSFPAPDNTDSYSEYQGKAGIRVGGLLRKSMLSLYLGDGTNLLFSDYIKPDSHVLIRRNVLDRVRHIAPFLMYDADPYIVISREGKLYWMIDAFTYSDRFPFSTGYRVGNAAVNYIRNSVKVVVDAYEGEVKFYVFEPDDPIIRSYQKIFPNLFHSREEMPDDLREHIRYPDLLAEVQARAYNLYHIQSPQTFYNREDLWAFANTETGQEGSEPSPMQPYYVLMILPGEQSKQLEFVSMLPFTPAGPGRNNMIGWLAQRSDGENYGQTLVFSFPRNITVNGPAQIKARVNQDAYLSGQISLWNTQGSRVIRSNLQAIPVADSILYIEPIYLQAVNSQLPELRQVALATQDKLATGKTFDEALAALFPQLASQRPAQAAQAASQPSPRQGDTQPAQQPASQPPAQAAAGDFERLAQQAQQLLTDYKRFTAEGKHREAGERLDQLAQTLAELGRRRGER